eukprot:405509_1
MWVSCILFFILINKTLSQVTVEIKGNYLVIKNIAFGTKNQLRVRQHWSSDASGSFKLKNACEDKISKYYGFFCWKQDIQTIVLCSKPDKYTVSLKNLLSYIENKSLYYKPPYQQIYKPILPKAKITENEAQTGITPAPTLCSKLQLPRKVPKKVTKKNKPLIFEWYFVDRDRRTVGHRKSYMIDKGSVSNYKMNLYGRIIKPGTEDQWKKLYIDDPKNYFTGFPGGYQLKFVEETYSDERFKKLLNSGRVFFNGRTIKKQSNQLFPTLLESIQWYQITVVLSVFCLIWICCFVIG